MLGVCPPRAEACVARAARIGPGRRPVRPHPALRVPGSLPIQLEPYRLLVGLVLLAWIASLLTDPLVRVRRSGLEGPLAVIAISVFGSVVVNPVRRCRRAGRGPQGFDVLPQLRPVLLLHGQRCPRLGRCRLGSCACSCSAGPSSQAALSSSTGTCSRSSTCSVTCRSSSRWICRSRIRAAVGLGRTARQSTRLLSAQLLVILLPLVIYLVRRHGRIWWLAAAFLLMGMVSTVSRTGVVMLAVALLSLLFMRPRQVWRWLPLLIPSPDRDEAPRAWRHRLAAVPVQSGRGDRREPEHVPRQHPGGQPAHRHRSTSSRTWRESRCWESATASGCAAAR